MEIRIFSIRFAKRKAKEKKRYGIRTSPKTPRSKRSIDAAPEGNPLVNEAKNKN